MIDRNQDEIITWEELRATWNDTYFADHNI